MKAMLLILPMIFCSQLALAANGELQAVRCGHLNFSVESLDINKLKASGFFKECDTFKSGAHKEKISTELVFLDYPGSGEILTLSRDKTDAPGDSPDFVEFDAGVREYKFNDGKFNLAMNDWPIYAGRMEAMMKGDDTLKTTQVFRCRNSISGNYVMSETRYTGRKSGRRWVEGYLMFYAKGVISVVYWSPLVALDVPAELERYQRMEAAFKSMKVTNSVGQISKKIRGCE